VRHAACSMRHATCSTQRATRNATCINATRINATCDVQHPCRQVSARPSSAMAKPSAHMHDIGSRPSSARADGRDRPPPSRQQGCLPTALLRAKVAFACLLHACSVWRGARSLLFVCGHICVRAWVQSAVSACVRARSQPCGFVRLCCVRVRMSVCACRPTHPGLNGATS
jgi:hypothetical protein